MKMWVHRSCSYPAMIDEIDAAMHGVQHNYAIWPLRSLSLSLSYWILSKSFSLSCWILNNSFSLSCWILSNSFSLLLDFE